MDVKYHSSNPTILQRGCGGGWEAVTETSRGMVSQITVSKQMLQAIGRGVLLNPVMLKESENRPQEVARFPQHP